MRRPLALLALVTATLTAASCDLVLEINVGSLDHATGTGGQGGTGGASFCTPGEKQECYTGPDGTQRQGICKAGEQTCNADGSAFGDCIGEQLPKVEDCATAEDDDCDGNSQPCSGTVLWAKRFGDANSQFARAVAVDPSANILLTGSFLGSVDFGGTPLTTASGFYSDVFVAKFDAAGSHLWSTSFGKSLSQRARGVASDLAGNVLVVGDFDGTIDFGAGIQQVSAGSSDVFLVKLDSSGAAVWGRSFGDSKAQAGYGVATDADGNTILVGSFGGSIDFGDGPHLSQSGTDIFVAKLDPGGATLWSRTYGGPQDQAAYGLAIDGQGNILLGGAFNGSVDFGDGLHTSADSADAFVAKLDPSGATQWSKTYGGPQDQAVYSLATDGQGDILMGGPFSGSIDFGDGPHTSAGGSDIFVAKLDPAGATSWGKTFGDVKDGQTAYSVAADQFGNAILGGAFDGTIDFGDGNPLSSGGGPDIFVVKLDPGGKTLWSRRFGDTGVQTATSVATDTAGNVVMSGYLDGTVDVGNMTLTSAGAEDIVLAKLAP